MSVNEVFTSGKTAVIIGSAEGIGRAAALECGARGMHVWLVDNNIKELKIAKELVKQTTGGDPKQKIQAIEADVCDEGHMKFVADTVFKDNTTKSVHFLMNNAAMSIGGGAIETPMKEFTKMMKVNLFGCIHACQSFIPTMKKKDQPGIIVNTGSKQGITCPPGNLTYNVTKAALKSWTEGLEHELMTERLSGDGKLTAAFLVPGWTNTSIKINELRDRAKLQNRKKFDMEAARSVCTSESNPADGAWMPKQVIDYMLAKLSEGSFYIICPDNEVDIETDKLRMTWAMQDVTEDRPPLSRWHPEWKGEFEKYLKAHNK